jgi:hypothetical protein
MMLIARSGGAWRIAPCGTQEVYIIRRDASVASVCNRVGNSGWAKKPMTVSVADLFNSRSEALAEYRQRRAAALKQNPHASLNLTTEPGQ